MQHKGTVQIETQRLVLRRFRAEDSEAAYRNWTSDEQVTEFLRWSAHENPYVTREIVDIWVAGYENNDFYHWAIVLKDGRDEPIGTIGAVKQNEALDIIHIGYCIGRQWWHRGITSEAFAAVIAFLFEEVGVNRIESQHDPHNSNSGKVMKKCGLKYEGTLRDADVSNKGIVDAAVYSILADEYFQGENK